MVNLSNLPEITSVTDDDALVHLRLSTGRDVKIKFSNLKAGVSSGGGWDSIKQYTAGDIVTHQDGVYIARRANINIEPDFTSNQDWLIKYKYDALASIPIGGLLFVDDYTTAKSPGNTLWGGQWASLQSTTYGQMWANPSRNESTGVDSNVYFYWNPQDLVLQGVFSGSVRRISGYNVSYVIDSSSLTPQVVSASNYRGRVTPQSFASFNPQNLNHHLRPRLRTMCGYRLEGYGDLNAIITGGKG